jgi:hypothetical protein
MVEIIKKLETAACWGARRSEEILSQLERSIWSGQDWDDLAAALEAAETAYWEGEISLSMAEGLAWLAAATGRRLPEKDAAKADEVIPGEDLSSTAGETCSCCGKAEWWSNAGRLVCAICHPHPEIAEEGRVAA